MGNSVLHCTTAISPDVLILSVGTADFPVVVDVRRRGVYDADTAVLPTARWHDHRAALDWGRALQPGRPTVVYCVHGHQVSLSAVCLLRSLGLDARFLEGGIEAYRAAGGPTIRKAALPRPPGEGPSQWVTRERPKIDRIACPWFIRRFVDREALIHYVPKDWVIATAEEIAAIPFDIPDVEFSHNGEACSFDAFITRFGLRRSEERRVVKECVGTFSSRWSPYH